MDCEGDKQTARKTHRQTNPHTQWITDKNTHRGRGDDRQKERKVEAGRENDRLTGITGKVTVREDKRLSDRQQTDRQVG